MAIITISRGCFCYGRTIAGRVARKMGYVCVNREIMLEAAQFYNISEEKLFQTLHDFPGMLDKITRNRSEYLDCFRSVLLADAKEDNMVCHGHAGHFLLPQAAHVLKVRVMADMPDLR